MDRNHETPTPAADTREAGRRTLNQTVAQRQKLLLGGIGAVALIGGAMFIFGGDDDAASGDSGAATIDTGGLVNRNLSSREFVATYGNRLDAQGREIKALKDAQLPRPAIEQELDALRSENAQMRADGQAAIDAISAENAALRTQINEAANAPPALPRRPRPPTGPAPAIRPRCRAGHRGLGPRKARSACSRSRARTARPAREDKPRRRLRCCSRRARITCRPTAMRRPG